MRFRHTLSNQVHQCSSRSDISWSLGNKVRDLACGVVERDFNPAPFEAGVSLLELEIFHETGYLSALVFAEAEFGFDDVAAITLELLHALLDEMSLSALLGDGCSNPRAREVGLIGFAGTNSVLNIAC